MFGGTIFGVVRRAVSKRASRNAFPALGAKLGLVHVKPETPGAAGVLKGSYGGHDVRLESEARARAVVMLPQPIPVELRNYEHWKRVPNGYQSLTFEEQKLNSWLKNRFASAKLSASWARDPELCRLLRQLRTDEQLREFAVTPERIELVFDYGIRGLFPALRAEQALSLALTLAKRLERLTLIDDESRTATN